MKRRRKIPGWVETLLYVFVTLAVTSIIKTFIVQMYSIPSESMEPTTFKGDRVVVDQLSTWFGSEPARGEVVVFHDPNHWLPAKSSVKTGIDVPGEIANAGAFVGILPDQKDDLLIKRIIGVGGDVVECRNIDGPVYLNGKPLVENYILDHQRPCDNGVYAVTVPTGMLWMLGDNREHSGDSAWNFVHQGPTAGFVPRKNVVGHVIGVISWLEDKRAPDPLACPTAVACPTAHPGVVTTVPAP